MARNYQRDERDSRRGQEQNSSEQNRWSGRRRDDDYDWNDERQQGSDWRRQGQQGDWRGNSEIDDRWSPSQGMSGGQRPFGTNAQRQWGRNMERENPEGWSEWSEGYGQLGGRGWYEGYSDAMHREQGQQGQHAGRGPRNYKRSDNRIEEDVNDRLTQHSMIDATDIEVSVQNGEVTLKGYVENRRAKRLAEDIAESVSGVKDVNNQIKMRQRGSETENEPSGKQRKAS